MSYIELNGISLGSGKTASKGNNNSNASRKSLSDVVHIITREQLDAIYNGDMVPYFKLPLEEIGMTKEQVVDDMKLLKYPNLIAADLHSEDDFEEDYGVGDFISKFVPMVGHSTEYYSVYGPSLNYNQKGIALTDDFEHIVSAYGIEINTLAHALMDIYMYTEIGEYAVDFEFFVDDNYLYIGVSYIEATT